MIDAEVESLISLTDAAKILPARRAGKKPHVSCLYRWTTAGCRGVRLEYVQVGSTRCTSREALARFMDRLTACNNSMQKTDNRSTGPAIRTASKRRRDSEAAAKELQKLGI